LAFLGSFGSFRHVAQPNRPLGVVSRCRQKETAFFELAERFRASSDPQEIKRLGDELGRFVFGE
jgi:hypothetical protein